MENQAIALLLDSRKYEIEYTDRATEVFAANTIAENLLALVGDQGQRNLMINVIEDCRKTADAVPKEKGTTGDP